MELKKYKHYRLTDSREVLSAVLSEETLDYVAKNNIKGSFFAFDGVDEIIQKGALTDPNECIVPGIGPLPARIDGVRYPVQIPGDNEYKEVQEYFKDLNFGSGISYVIQNMSVKHEWDEKYYYNLIALCEFVNAPRTKMTLGEFCKKKRKRIDKAFMNGSSQWSYDTELVLKEYGASEFRAINDNENFQSLTQKEVIDFFNFAPHFSLVLDETVAASDYEVKLCTQNVNGIIHGMRTDKSFSRHRQVMKIHKAIIKLVKESKSHDIQNHNKFCELLSLFAERATHVIGVFNTEMFIDSLSDYSSVLSPEEILSLVACISEHQTLFSKSDGFEVHVVVLDILSDIKNHKDFLKFISDQLESYNGPVPLFSEVMNAVYSGEDFSLGPDLVIPFISASPVFLTQHESNRRTATRGFFREALAHIGTQNNGAQVGA